MNRIIKADLYRYGRRTGCKGFLGGWMIPGFRFMVILRKAARMGKFSPAGIFYRLWLRRLGFRFGYQIPVSTRIGEGFYIGHFGTIVINAEAVIGTNCNIAHGVTVGQASRGDKQGSPTIGDHVWMGTGSVIVGKITIGSDVLIAPNSYVNMDVPDHSLVIGNPAKIIARENVTEGYINNAYPGEFTMNS